MTNLWGEPSPGGHHPPDLLPYGRHTAWRENAVSVATLLAEAQRDGRPLWLDWPDESTRPAGPASTGDATEQRERWWPPEPPQ